MKKGFVKFAIACVSVGIMFTACTKAPQQTQENLKVVIASKATTGAMFAQFSTKALELGDSMVAPLFQAIASEELQQAESLQQILVGKGVVDFTAAPAEVAVDTTEANIAAALVGLDSMVNKVLPGFIETAQVENDTITLAAFNALLAADTNKINLLKEAVAMLAAADTVTAPAAVPAGSAAPALAAPAVVPVAAVPATPVKK